jgi:hypothetical protein
MPSFGSGMLSMNPIVSIYYTEWPGDGYSPSPAFR